jgi:imidazolonepropionase-like amidohydrolase
MRPKWRQLGTALVVVTVFISVRLTAQDVQPTIVLFQNVRVFDGKSGTLSGPSNVLVRGNKIERISRAPIPTDRSAKTQIIEGSGRTLMPGLIDVHWHAMLIRANPVQAIVGDAGYNNIAAGVEATDTLMRGFTTVRDVGGPVFGLKSAIDSGIIRGAAYFSLRGCHHGDQRARRFSSIV